MAELYHCFYKEPQGEAILASCFREVNGVEKNYLFAATYLTKALAFGFSYHDGEVILNSGVENSDNEFVLLCGGQETLDKKRHIRVFGFPDDGFKELPRSRQAVSESPMPFSRARLVMETTNIDDLMKKGLQIFVLPEKLAAYLKPNSGESFVSDDYWQGDCSNGEAMDRIMKELGARWINRERGINPCPLLGADIPETPRKNAVEPGFMPR